MAKTSGRRNLVDGVTEAERKLITLIAEGHTRADAYRAVYGDGEGPIHIRQAVMTILRRPQVKVALEKLERNIAAKMGKVASAIAVNRERISQTLAAIAFSRGKLLAEDGTEVMVSIKDIRAAAMDLARLHGWIIERRDVRVIRSIEDLSDDELIALTNGTEGRDGTRH